MTTLTPHTFYNSEDLVQAIFPDDEAGQEFIMNLFDGFTDGNSGLVWISPDYIQETWALWSEDEENEYANYTIDEWTYLNELAAFLDEEFGEDTEYGRWYEPCFHYWC